MIASLQGTLVSKSPTEIVVDVQGIGYAVNIPLSTYEALGELKATVSLFTYLHVREDALQLYGFASVPERDLFRMLISVTGIGPKMAQGILSGIAVEDLRSHIALGHQAALMAVPGVGRKLADRLIVELRDKVTRLETAAGRKEPAGGTLDRVRTEALLALTSLGYSRAGAEKALRAALQELEGKEASVEVLIKAALRHATT